MGKVLSYTKLITVMSSVAASSLDQNTLNDLATTYAALILLDGGKPITEEALTKTVNASGLKANANFIRLFAKGTTGQDLNKFLVGGGGAGGAPAPAAAAAPAKGGDAKKEDKKPVVEEKKEEEDVAVGGLFDDFQSEFV
eukprot:TRINITY_DN1768_c0_g1_i3.p3 TRINITY_DN1768_c0_g1~~TRINITY_DN1768_c0_g1_i3.p3  ORF type:complete len:140 (-),score=74.34 TRINITY_DN1768_c0_g1_i3:317-736(-)